MKLMNYLHPSEELKLWGFTSLVSRFCFVKNHLL